VKSLFSGKHASNNRRILKKLLVDGPLNNHTLSRRLGIDSTTIFDRIHKLAEQGIIEEKGKRPGKKNKQQLTVFWGLSALGLWVAAHAVPMIARRDSKSRREKKEQEARTIRGEGLAKCRETISGYWERFTEIYQLDKVETDEPFYQSFTQWLTTDEGVLHFLDTFGAWPLAGRAAALGTFRRMIDLALLRLHGAWLEILPAYGVEHTRDDWIRSADSQNPYQALGELAARHKKLRKLDTILQEVDVPLYAYLEKTARDELVQELSLPLGEATARKLAVTPFFADQKMSRADVSSQTLGLLSPNAFFDIGARIWIKPDRVSIETDNPDKINPAWKDYCDLDVIEYPSLRHTRIPAKKRSR